MLDQAREGAWRGLDAQRTRAASGLGAFVDALRQGGHELKGQHATVASYVDAAATQIDRAVGTLRERDLRRIAADVESFARQRPMLFLGGAFALGLATARFLKSSEPPMPPRRMQGRRRMPPTVGHEPMAPPSTTRTTTGIGTPTPGPMTDQPIGTDMTSPRISRE